MMTSTDYRVHRDPPPDGYESRPRCNYQNCEQEAIPGLGACESCADFLNLTYDMNSEPSP